MQSVALTNSNAVKLSYSLDSTVQFKNDVCVFGANSPLSSVFVYQDLLKGANEVSFDKNTFLCLTDNFSLKEKIKQGEKDNRYYTFTTTIQTSLGYWYRDADDAPFELKFDNTGTISPSIFTIIFDPVNYPKVTIKHGNYTLCYDHTDDRLIFSEYSDKSAIATNNYEFIVTSGNTDVTMYATYYKTAYDPVPWFISLSAGGYPNTLYYSTSANDALDRTLYYLDSTSTFTSGGIPLSGFDSTEETAMEVSTGDSFEGNVILKTFNYFYGNGEIVLFTDYNDQQLTEYSYVSQFPLYNVVDSGVVKMRKGVVIKHLNYGSDYWLSMPRFSKPLDFKIGQHNIVKYKSKKGSLELDTSKFNKEASLNYLISCPFKGMSNEWDVNIANLKNQYTPENGLNPTYDKTTLTEKYIPARTYNHIFSDIGDNIYLEFTASTVRKRMAKDKNTYFHYPNNSLSVPISLSNLESFGAIGANVPYLSDVIFKKQAGYADFTNWGNSLKKDGVMYCTWLSAGDVLNTNVVWIDRTYTTLGGITTFEDTPSTNLFEQGVLYSYYRMGEGRNAEFLASVSDNLIYNLNDFSETVIDENSGVTTNIVGFSADNISQSEKYNEPQYLLESQDYIKTINNSDILGIGDLTINFNIDISDTEVLNFNQIYGNYFYGGLSFAVNNEIFCPYFTVFSSSDKKIGNVSLSANIVETTGNGSFLNGVSYIHVEKTFFDSPYYLIYGSNIAVSEPDNIVTNVKMVKETGSITHTHLNSDGELLFIHSSQPSVIYKTDLSLYDPVSAYDIGANTDFCVRYDGVVIPHSYHSMVYDGNGNQFTIRYVDSDYYLYKNEYKTYVLSNPEVLYCDHENNLWVIYSGNKIAKFTNDVVLIFKKTVTSSLNNKLRLNFSVDLNGRDKIFTILLIGTADSYISTIDPYTGEIVNTTTVNGVSFGGDFTGYQFQRKFNQKNVDKQFVLKYLYSDSNIINNKQFNRVYVSGEYLNVGVNNIGVVFSSRNNVNVYINGKSSGSYIDPNQSPSKKIYNYKNNSEILVGVNSYKKENVKTVFEKSYSTGYTGYVSGFRIYKKAFDQFENYALYKNVLKTSYSDLKWDVPTQERSYIEEIERVFIHRVPGSKSNKYNLIINNSSHFDEETKNGIELSIREYVQDISPINTDINEVIFN